MFNNHFKSNNIKELKVEYVGKLFQEHSIEKEFSYTDVATVVTIREHNIENLITYDIRSFTHLIKHRRNKSLEQITHKRIEKNKKHIKQNI